MHRPKTAQGPHDAATPLRVAIQGIAGCFHDAAARSFYAPAEVSTVECETFPAMFETLDNDPSLSAIMAIDNTIAGHIDQGA